MGTKGRIRRLLFLLVFATFLLQSCGLSQVDPLLSDAAVPLSMQAVSTSPSPTREASSPTFTTAAIPDLEQAAVSLPTAIAGVIWAAFPTQEATVTATTIPSPTATAIPLPTATPCDAPGKIVTGTFPSETAGQSPYRVYLPPCYEEGERVYPTLYMLPGNIHTDSVWDNLGLDDAAEKAINRGDIPPLLIVMATGGQLSNYTSGGPFSYESVILDDLIPHIERTYCAWQDPSGRAIGGMSRGGYWALEIAFRHPDQFASVGGHSAALLDLYGGPEVLPQVTGLANDLGDLRIYFDIGEYDWVLPNIQKLHEDLDSVGMDHVWIVNEGRHEDAYWASHTDEYITWYSDPWSMQRDSYPPCVLESVGQSE